MCETESRTEKSLPACAGTKKWRTIIFKFYYSKQKHGQTRKRRLGTRRNYLHAKGPKDPVQRPVLESPCARWDERIAEHRTEPSQLSGVYPAWARPLTKGHQKRRGNRSWRTMAKRHTVEKRKRRTGRMIWNGGNTYAFSAPSKADCANKSTPAESGVGQGEKWRSSKPSGPLCMLESRDIKSTVSGPQRVCKYCHAFWSASMQSATDKTLDGASAQFSLDGTCESGSPILARSDSSKVDLITEVRSATLSPWFCHAKTEQQRFSEGGKRLPQPELEASANWI